MSIFTNIFLRGVRVFIASVVRISLWPFAASEHSIVRFATYRYFEALPRLNAQPERPPRVLAISGSQYLANLLFPSAQIETADYPEVSILNLPYPDGTFDAIVADQVLEHVRGDPRDVFTECARCLRSGGVMVQAMPFLYQIHAYPSDYWRITPDGLRYLSEGIFSNIIDIGGWGNRYVGILSWLGLEGANVPQANWHPFHQIALLNEPNNPVQVWIVAEK
jgi:SAM-dependent methyltransferase